MHNTSSVNVVHKEGINIIKLSNTLAGLPAKEFDLAVRPLRKYLEQFDEDGELSKLMLETNVTNHLIDGLYVRELLIPKNAVILSRVHKRPLVNIISQGRVIVVDTNGRNEYKAPCTFISPAGTQRLVFSVEETVWNTAHLTDVTNEEDLVDDLTYDNYEEYTNVLLYRGSVTNNDSSDDTPS